MTDPVSIWRWTGTENLEAVLRQIYDGTPSEETAEATAMAKRVEEKYRAMGLPHDLLQTMLDGLKSLSADAEQIAAQDDDAEHPLDPQGAVTMSLASSQSFDAPPFSNVSDAEIERQVHHLMGTYRDAVTKLAGNAGQSFASFLGHTLAQMNQSETQEVLSAAGMSDINWVWVEVARVLYLSLSYSDVRGIVDIEFAHAPKAAFESVKTAL